MGYYPTPDWLPEWTKGAGRNLCYLRMRGFESHTSHFLFSCVLKMYIR